MAARQNWIDTAKGFGIVLVVCGHLMSSAVNSGVALDVSAFKLIDSVIYSFHMPLFFFLSGLLVNSSLQKRSTGAFIKSKFLALGYPYLVWSLVQTSVELAFPQHSRHGFGFQDLTSIFYIPVSQFWFLYALFLMNLAYAVVWRRKSLLVVLGAVAVILFVYPLPTKVFALSAFSTHFAFFLCGIAIGREFTQATLPIFPVSVTVGLSISFFVAAYWTFTSAIEPVRLANSEHVLYFAGLSILGVGMTIGLAQLADRVAIMRIFNTLGIYSVQIYLVHMLAGAGMRIVAQMVLSVGDPMVLVTLSCLAGIFAPVVFYKACMM